MCGSSATESARVDVEPQALGGAEVGELVQRVDGARAHGARARGHGERALAAGAVAGDGGAQRAHVHPMLGVGRNPMNRLAAEPEQLGGLLKAAVAFIREIEHEGCPRPLEPVAPHVPAVVARRPMARRREGDERGRRAATRQEPHAARGRESDQLHEPPHGGALDVDRRVVAAGAAWIHGGGEEVGEHADRCRRRVHPAEEARVAVAHGVRQDGGADAMQQGFGIEAGRAERLLHQRGALGRGHRFEHGPLGHAGQIVDDEVDGFMRQTAEVLGIKGGRRRSRHREGLRWRRRGRTGL